MDPITLLLALLVGGAAAAVVTVLTWTAVQTWINRHAIPGGFGEVVRTRMASGRYSVVTGVFDCLGVLRASAKWEVGSFGPELEARFVGADNRIHVAT